MAYTREFWEEQKFNENDHSFGEGAPFTNKRRRRLQRMPFYMNLIVLNHHKNVTNNLRELKDTEDIEQGKQNSLLSLLETDDKKFIYRFSDKLIKDSENR